MRHYCLGFAFDPDQDRVLLLRKRSTDRFNPDAWNGLGGKVEAAESAVEAMSRECAEEAGLRVDPPLWHSLGQLTDQQTYCVEVFACLAPLEAAFQQTDEVIRVFDRTTAQALDYAEGVDDLLQPWLAGGRLL